MPHFPMEIEGEMFIVTECSINPSSKDLSVCLKELCFNRPAAAQRILLEVIDKLNEL